MSVAAEYGGSGPEHPDGWTVEDLLAMPEHKQQRVELVHGNLVVTPAPGRPHQWASYELQVLLKAAAKAAGAEVDVLATVDVVVPAGLFVPDLVIASTAITRQETPTLDAADLLAVVEIVSPSSRRMDRLVKPGLYAEGGVPVYWRLELDGTSAQLVVYRLEDGRYVEQVNAKSGRVAEVSVPFPVSVDPADLVWG